MFGKRNTVFDGDRSAPTMAKIVPLNRDRSVIGPMNDDDKPISDSVMKYYDQILNAVTRQIDLTSVFKLDESVRATQLREFIRTIVTEEKVVLAEYEQEELINILISELLGFGPLEVLLADDEVTDIMVNAYDRVFVEKRGTLHKSNAKFRSEAHLLNVIQKIASLAGRRIDQTSPMVDARLPDGSRFNAVVPPLCRTSSISIRKFPKNNFSLADLVEKGSMTSDMAIFLNLASRMHQNILISGGTGSGKTTLLKAIANTIDDNERIITIEDTLELNLKHTNIVALEGRPKSIEGTGEITLQNLLVNSLRMRPNRIVVGEVRGAEAGEMIQAMNTGHPGSLGTIHANNPRECLMRLENLVCMDSKYRPGLSTRTQISNAVNIIVQVSRMNDGSRRVTSIDEVVGMEGEVYILQTLFKFEIKKETSHGAIVGTHVSTGLKPKFCFQNSSMHFYDCEQRMLSSL